MILTYNAHVMYWNSAQATTSKPIPVYTPRAQPQKGGMLDIDKANFKPGQPDSVYRSAADFKKAVGKDPGPSDEIPPVSPGPLFNVGFAMVILFCGGAVLSGVLSRRFVPGFITVGYVASWMMWVPGNEQRILFFYHALGLLLFTALALAYGLTALKRTRFAGMTLAPAAWGLLGTVVASFIFFYPVWTGSPLPQADAGMRTWYDTQ
jgi:hypothetical protein